MENLITKRNERDKALFNSMIQAIEAGDCQTLLDARHSRLIDKNERIYRWSINPCWATNAKQPMTALMVAATAPLSPKAPFTLSSMIEALLPVSDPMIQNEQGMTALMFAAWSGTEEGVEALLPLSDAEEKDKDGLTALMHAAKAGAADRVKALLPFSDPTAKDECGRTALMYAAEKGDAKCLQALLPLSDPMAMTRDGMGDTALTLAAKNGSAVCLQALLPFSDPIADRLKLREARNLAAVQGHADCAQALDERLTQGAVDSLASKLDQRREHAEPAGAPKPVIRTPKG